MGIKNDNTKRPGNPGVVNGEIQQRRNITLSDRLADKARKLGNGNVSDGIRRALEIVTVMDNRRI